MSFYNIISGFNGFDFNAYLNSLTERRIEESLNKENLTYYDLLNLLSDKALKFLEPMAVKAKKLTRHCFGYSVLLYTPLYISNYCTNECLYCGFNRKSSIHRKQLSFNEIEMEAEKIAAEGIQHVLILTGEDRIRANLEYLKESITLLNKYFHSVSIEIYPLDEKEYAELKITGVDGLTIYQEVYDKEIYYNVHLSGRKRDYHYRLDAPERGAAAGFRTVNIGALFGVGEVIKEAFFTGLHAKYLSDKYLDSEFSISLPRINPEGLDFKPEHILHDRKLVQFFLALRIFLPRIGLTLSTRESSFLRDKLVSLCITKLSAGSRTSVGGYSGKVCENGQFSVRDNRSIKEVSEAVKSAGCQAIFKDWEWLDSVQRNNMHKDKFNKNSEKERSR